MDFRILIAKVAFVLLPWQRTFIKMTSKSGFIYLQKIKSLCFLHYLLKTNLLQCSYVNTVKITSSLMGKSNTRAELQ